MTINCSLYCNDETFLTFLNRFQITKGSHSRSEDMIESLVSCLSCLRPEAEIRQLVQILTTESEDTDRGISVQTESLMHVGSEFEYGRHNDMYFFNSESIVGLFMALSKALNIRILVICGRLPLRILHKDQFVLQFNYGDENSSKIVIGLVGLTILHKLNQPDSDSPIWNRLLIESHNISETLLRNISDDLNQGVDSLDSPNIANEDAGPVETVIPRTVNASNHNLHNVTIAEFIQNNSSNIARNRLKIEDTAYFCRDRLDFNQSSSNDFSNESITELNHLFDIDGVFGYHNWENSEYFKGDVIFTGEPQFNFVRQEKVFKQLFIRSRISLIENLIFFKIGTSIGSKNIIYDIFFAGILSENNNN